MTPAWADAVEGEPEETLAVETVQEEEPASEEPEETEEPTEEEPAEETEETTEESAEESEIQEEDLDSEEELQEEIAAQAAADTPGVLASGACGKNLTWVLTEGGTLRISGSGYMLSYSVPSTAPWYAKRTKITALVVEPGVTSIGYSAFSGCSSLTSVSIPEGVTSIDDYTFSGCSSLTSVSIPVSVTKIISYAFYDCYSLKDVYYGGDEVAWKQIEIGYGNDYLTRAYIHYGQTHICTLTPVPGVTPTHTAGGNNAYYTCTACRKVFADPAGTQETTPEQERLPKLPGIAGGQCGGLSWVLNEEGTLTISGNGRMPNYSGSASAPWAAYRQQIVALEVEEGVRSIGDDAFFDCRNLRAIRLPDSLTELGKNCFSGCDSLALLSLSVPEQLTEKTTDLTGLAALPENLAKLAKAAFVWTLDTAPGEPENLAKLEGTSLTVLRSGAFRLVCREAYTGLTASALVAAQVSTAIRGQEQLVGGETLELSLLAMPFETELEADWSLTEESKPYATVTAEGILTAKPVAEPVQITVKAQPKGGEDPAERTIWILPKTLSVGILLDGHLVGDSLTADLFEKEELTLSAQMQPQGALAQVNWTSSREDVASIDDSGSVKLLKLEPEVSQEWGYAEDNQVYGEIAQVAGLGRSFRLHAQGQDYQGHWTEAANLTYESSNPAVAQVDGMGNVTLTAKAAGECVITVRSMDALGAEAALHILLRSSAPRLGNGKLTLNSYRLEGVSTGLVETWDNAIQSVTLYDYNKSAKRYEDVPSAAFEAEAADDTLTIRAKDTQKNGTYQLKLTAACLGGSYDYILQVKVANSLPKVTVKQVGKFDLFYLDSTAKLDVTAAGCLVERLTLTGANTFRMEEDGTLFYQEGAESQKLNAKGTLQIFLEGYQVPVSKAVTVATMTTSPKLTTDPGSSAVNLALAEPECRVKVRWSGKTLDLTDADISTKASFVTLDTEGETLIFRLTGTTGGAVDPTIRLPGWAKSVTVKHKITVESKLPAAKLAASTLKLNSLFTAQEAKTAIWLTQGNLDIGGVEFVSTAKAGTSTRTEAEKIALSYDPETKQVEAKFASLDSIPKAGTYSYRYTVSLENGTALPAGTIKVTVSAPAPKVKLSASAVKLNRYLAEREQAQVKLTMTGGTGYRVTDPENMPDYMDYDLETGILTVTLPDASFTGQTCTMKPVVRDEATGQEVTLGTKLTLKVQTINTSKLSVTLSAKGKLDTTKPDSAIAYTVTKVGNCLNFPDSVKLEGPDANRFQAELDTSGSKPVVQLRLLDGQTYATNKTYKVQFRFTICGTEVLSAVQSVKVSQTTLKVTAPKTVVYYLTQSAPLRCTLTANVPMDTVTLNTRTSKELLAALGDEDNLSFTDGRLELRLTNPGALKAGKSYILQLNVTPENRAENISPTVVKLTIKATK